MHAFPAATAVGREMRYAVTKDVSLHATSGHEEKTGEEKTGIILLSRMRRSNSLVTDFVKGQESL